MLTTALSNTPAPTYGHDHPNIMHKYTKRRHILHTSWHICIHLQTSKCPQAFWALCPIVILCSVLLFVGDVYMSLSVGMMSCFPWYTHACTHTHTHTHTERERERDYTHIVHILTQASRLRSSQVEPLSNGVLESQPRLQLLCKGSSTLSAVVLGYRSASPTDLRFPVKQHTHTRTDDPADPTHCFSASWVALRVARVGTTLAV